MSPWPAVPAAVAAASVIGLLYAQVFNRLGVPSFVITLAGLRGFLGVQLWVLGTKGAINLPFDSGLVTFAQLDFLPAWLSYTLTVVAAASLFVTGYLRTRTRREAGLPAASAQSLMLRSIVLPAGVEFAVWYLGRTCGVGWMFVLFLALVLATHYLPARTRFSKSISAVGGNVEAARRAGINVKAPSPSPAGSRCSTSTPPFVTWSPERCSCSRWRWTRRHGARVPPTAAREDM